MIDQLVDAIVAVVDVAPTSLPDIDRVQRSLRLPRQEPVASGFNEQAAARLDAAVAFAHNDDDRRLARLAAACGSKLPWFIAYADHTEPDMVALHEGYRVAAIMGPRHLSGTIITSDEASMYLSIQGPGVLYPSHVHKAPELYHVIAGEGLWQRGDGEYTAQPPGAWIDHPTGTRHSMRTVDQPMLSLAIWTADLDSISEIVRT
ncbi:MAG: hypothetical protein HKN94_13325 [Acidimicrobiales bacterium]|nr:hypothetical protein [Acidimicrobiales bacterium]